MKLRELGPVGLAIALAVCVTQAGRAEGQRPSRSTLDEMGLGGLVVMSDDEAMGIRGQGFNGGGSSVAVFGNSFATFTSPFGTSHSENGYAAEGSRFAFGKNSSHAGVEIKTIHGNKGRKNGGAMGGKVWRGKPGGKMGGHPKGGHRGGRVSVKSIRVFAGGHSFAVAR